MFSGNLGSNTYKSKSLIFESEYQAKDYLSFNLSAGQIAGEDGDASNYAAVYLHPNYQIANLLFRYNLRAVNNPALSVYDSYIVNATYLKFKLSYQTNKWTWDAAFIWATAEETAKDGMMAYNHQTGERETAQHDQKADMGYEIDLNFNYQWNNEISVGGLLGFLFTGDYFATPNSKAENSILMQLNTAVRF